MVDETPDEADNEITRIVRRPGPKVLPVSIMTPTPAGEAPPVAVPPRAPANDVAPAAAAAPPVMLDRPRPVMTPPQRPAAPPPPHGLVPPLAARPGPVTPVIAPEPIPSQVGMDAPKPASLVAPAVTPVEAAKPAAPTEAHSDPIEPVVGWLVVVKGPGRGASRTIVTGRNSLGSGPDEDIRIDFGDAAIAPHGHLYIVYDEEAREFVVEDGKQKVVVRLNGKLLTETMPIGHGDDLRIGATTFRFVALCGPDFDWHERPVEEKPTASDGASDVPAVPASEAEAP